MKFIDVCSGIGGFRIALESLGHTCVGFSEIDKHAIKVYKDNFNTNDEVEIGDITTCSDLPEHDIMCAGFPCQPFSLAGKKRGFEDSRGNIFDSILNLAAKHKTEILILENVKGLLTVDGGKAFAAIVEKLKDEGYIVSYKVICGTNVTIQKRERLFIMAHRTKKFEFADLSFKKKYFKFSEIMDHDAPGTLTISSALYEFLMRHKNKHISKGNGFGFSLVSGDNSAVRTITKRYHKDGSECLIDDGNELPRKLSLKELKRLFTFPENYIMNASTTRSFMLFGNAVIVDIVKEICARL